MKRFSSFLLTILFITACLNKPDHKQINGNNPFYDAAIAFVDSQEVDSSFTYFSKAKDVFLQQKDSLGAGKCLVNMGYIAKNIGDYYAAQEISLSAISYFDETKKEQAAYICSNFNTLGLASYQLREYTSALKFYNAAIKFVGSPIDKFICLNNIAKVYEEQERYEEAIKIYTLVLNGTVNNSIEHARAMTNLSFAKWLQNSNYKALPSLLEALSIRKQEDDSLGQNHSYACLADFYEKTRPDSALIYSEKMYLVAKRLNSAADRLEALDKLIKSSPSTKSKGYFETYRELEDSVQIVRNASKNQFAVIRYETEKHKANNLILLKDNAEKKYQLIKQRTFLICGLVLAFFVIVISIVLYKKRKQRIELASQNAIRENQLKTSKKVHDVVANGLYRVMTEIENNGNLDKDQVLDKLEDMYEKSRDISYEEIHYSDQNFHEKISALLKSFATETTKVVFVGNTEELWKKIGTQTKYEIEHVLQELMINMKKHSNASNVAIRFEQKENKIAIYYADNGGGMSPDQQFNNGLTNTGNRIININGEITFDTKVEKGLKIQISFPVS